MHYHQLNEQLIISMLEEILANAKLYGVNHIAKNMNLYGQVLSKADVHISMSIAAMGNEAKFTVGGRCLKRVDQTDVVIPLSEVK